MTASLADYFGPSGPPELWPHECSICGVVCHNLDELTDHKHHDLPKKGQPRKFA